MPDASRQLVHASCVAVSGKAVLITGASGSGKSSLALQLMAYGATLISDDQTELTRSLKGINASAPKTIAGLIEARGVGILKADCAASSVVALVVDMDKLQTHRLPPPLTTTLLGVTLPCLHKADTVAFPAAILQYLRCGPKKDT